MAAGTPATRSPFVGGNWKCASTVEVVDTVTKALTDADLPSGTDVVLFPPAIHIDRAKRATDDSQVEIGVQNVMARAGFGAFTGEISTAMAADFGLKWVMVGHSERRSLNGETNEETAEKARLALADGMKVCVCVGESLEQREAGSTNDVICAQLAAVAAVLSKEDWSNVVVAYEPVWAIGTGKVATPTIAQETHSALRAWMAETVDAEVAAATRIVYGGSVKPANAAGLFAEADIDGFLVGGASLKPEFAAVIQAATA